MVAPGGSVTAELPLSGGALVAAVAIVAVVPLVAAVCEVDEDLRVTGGSASIKTASQFNHLVR